MAVASAGGKTITAYLKRVIGTPVGQMIPLDKSEMSIGRTRKTDICIPDPNISRSHATLNYSSDCWSITDLGGVNGTYLDNEQLMSGTPHPLKDGSVIYMGPPSDSPVAFVFIKTKVEETPKTSEENIHEKTKKEPLNDSFENQLTNTQPNSKRRADSNSVGTPIKKQALPISGHQSPVRSQSEIPVVVPVSSHSRMDDQESDTSIHSFDSLRTRIHKLNSRKKKEQSAKARADTAASTSSGSTSGCAPISEAMIHKRNLLQAKEQSVSAWVNGVASISSGPSSSTSVCAPVAARYHPPIRTKPEGFPLPILSEKKEQSANALVDSMASTSRDPSSFDVAPSTSAKADPVLKPKRKSKACEKLRKKIAPGVFKELESVFNDSDSAEIAAGGEDSESLLTESTLIANDGSNARSQSDENDATKQTSDNIVLDKSLRKKRKIKQLNEKLQEAHKKLLKENSEQKKKLNKFMEQSTSKVEPKENIEDMLEEELICNICTEVFIKATTLGCSHTFCEYCIYEWKKKQKKCPMCREVIISETSVLIMDKFIDKAVEKLGKEYQDKRKEVIATRRAAVEKDFLSSKCKKPKRKRAGRARAPRAPATPHRLSPINILTPSGRIRIVLGDQEDTDSEDSRSEICSFCGEMGHNISICPRLYE